VFQIPAAGGSVHDRTPGMASSASNITWPRKSHRDFGGGDLRDILFGVDEAIRTAPVDTQRIGITGWSYGGFMTMLAVTQTNRFRAAVAGAGISNWQSYYGKNAIDTWMIPYFSASVYDYPAVFAQDVRHQFHQ
jgi:poly(3-hydroxybutyrate) depolymerase